MTVGMIFECGPQGADKQVCEYLAKQLIAGVELSIATLDNKDKLLREAGAVAARMLADGCHCVLIIWDLRPAWPGKGGKPCRAAERAQVLATLGAAGIPTGAPVYPICIEQELESWLLANEAAVGACLSTPTHAYAVKPVRNPDQVTQPKAAMIKHFKARGRRYNDVVDALRVLKASPFNVNKMRRSSSFSRFEDKLHACC